MEFYFYSPPSGTQGHCSRQFAFVGSLFVSMAQKRILHGPSIASPSCQTPKDFHQVCNYFQTEELRARGVSTTNQRCVP